MPVCRARKKGYILDQFRKHLELYKDIDKRSCAKTLSVFLKAIIPVASSWRAAVHPDDPPRLDPWPAAHCFTIEDMQWMVDTVNSMNGFTMCTVLRRVLTMIWLI
ncbi:mannonate dehydratase [Escherichia coli]|nr:mannonate dehydratase [Escherichia coli]